MEFVGDIMWIEIGGWNVPLTCKNGYPHIEWSMDVLYTG